MTRLKSCVDDLTEEDLEEDFIRRDLISYNILGIGTFISKVSENLQNKYDDFPSILGFYNEYGMFGESQIWEVLQHETLSPLLFFDIIEKMFREEVLSVKEGKVSEKEAISRKEYQYPFTTEHKHSTSSKSSIWTVKKK